MLKKSQLAFCFILLGLYSCKDAQYVMRQSDKNLKYQYAMNWYMNKKYMEAIPVIENVMPNFKGSDTATNLYFMLADCYFLNKEYMVAAYHFKTFRDIYPKSYKAEVAAFKIAECYKNEIPRIELEQTDNEKAINYYRAFIAEYPKSPMVDLADNEIQKLNTNLEKKALLAADLYYNTKNYRAAAVTYKNVLAKYPKIKAYEDLFYKIGISYYKFAEKSIITKQAERYETALKECQNFLNRFPTSKYSEELRSIQDQCRVNILVSSLKNASNYYLIEERPLYFNQSLELYDEYLADIKVLPGHLSFYKDKCYLGIIESHYVLLDGIKDKTIREERYNIFKENYHRLIDKFAANSPELRLAEEIYNKANQIIKS
jgi:outer membrane protein assembly factor BamD